MRITKYLLLMGVCLTGLSATLSATCSPAGTGGNYYVATTGSDSNPGSSCSPWRTLKHAASLANPGWTVHVAPGTYVGDVAILRNGTATQRIRFISDTHWAATIVGQGANNVVELGSNSTVHNGNYIDFIGFTVTGNANSRVGIATYGGNARVLSNHVHDVPAKGSTIGCQSGAGIFVGWNAARPTDEINNTVDGNYVHDVGLFPLSCNQTHGIYVATPRNLISNNMVFRSQAYGIHLYGYTTNETVVNNTVFNNGRGGIIVSSNGTVVDDYTTVNDNIVVNNGVTTADNGIREVSYPSGFIGSHITYSNNLTFGNRPGNYSLIVNRTTNPRTSGTTSTTFANYTGTQTGDYRLKSGSPALNTGTSSLAPKSDLNGGSRPQGGAFDIGAYEFGSSTPSWPWR